MNIIQLLEFPLGESFWNASEAAASAAQRDPIQFDWNGETYEFPRHATVDQIRTEYTRRTECPVLHPDVTRRMLTEQYEKRKAEDAKRNGDLVLEVASIDDAPERCSDALARWDANEYVVSALMGGLGPGYEACIQSLAFELIREFAGDAIPTLADPEWWESHGRPRRDAVVSHLNERFGFSGAQVGAASNLAFCVLRGGYKAALSRLPVDRLISVKKPTEAMQ